MYWMNYGQELETMAKALFGVYLIWVSWQDKKEMQVFRYSHLLGIVAIILQIILLDADRKEVTKGWLAAVCFLILLQIIACRFRWYGIADAMVLFLCGVWLFLKGGIDYYLQAYFVMEAFAGSVLWGIQLLKKNIKGLCLRQPVAYIPYICVAFILTNIVL